MTGPLREPRENKFWRRVAKTEGCWLWTGAADRYGNFWNGTRKVGAHVFAWQLANGPVPAGLDVCHTCDNPLCVRADHLFVGTRSANMQDCKVKGRAYVVAAEHKARGSASGTARLNESQVRTIREMRAAGSTCATLAVAFGVTPSNITSICRRRTWTHVE